MFTAAKVLRFRHIHNHTKSVFIIIPSWYMAYHDYVSPMTKLGVNTSKE